MELMSNTEYGDILRTKNIPDYEYMYLRDKFDEFLKQPLEKWMFIPCDENGNFLEEPIYKDNPDRVDAVIQFEYEQAKERVLFEGFQKSNISGFDFQRNYSLYRLKNYNNIEDLVDKIQNLTLTKLAIKQIGL